MKNKLLKVSVLSILGICSLASCGNNNSSKLKTKDEIASEAIALAGLVTEVDLDNVQGQLSLTSQALVYVDKAEEDEKSAVNIPFTYTANDPSKWTFTEPTADNVIYATPKIEAEAYNFTITASVTYEGVTKTKEFKGKVTKTENGGQETTTMTIQELAKQELETTQTIEGIVFCAPKAQGQGFFVLDDTGIVYVYDKGAQTVTTGNKVRITGNYTKYIGYSYTYQIDISKSGTCEVIDTGKNELPVKGAKELDLATNTNFQKTELDAAGVMSIYHVHSYLVGYVNSSYGSPAYELCTTADGKGKYLPWYPGSDQAFDLYGSEYGTFDKASPLTSKNDGVINDGKEHDFYIAVFNSSLNDDKSFKKLNIIPVCYKN